MQRRHAKANFVGRLVAALAILMHGERFIVAVGLLAIVAPAHADKCTALKLKAIGKKEKGLLTCHSKVAVKGDPSLLDACVAKVEGKYLIAFGKAGTCGGDPTVCECLALNCAAAIRADLPDAGPSKCEAALLKAAAKKAAGKLTCSYKASLKGIAVEPLCIQKVEAKYQTAFAKVTGCSGDQNLVETDVDQQCVTAVGGDPTGGTMIGAICDSCTAATTTTTLGGDTTTTILGTTTTTTTTPASTTTTTTCPNSGCPSTSTTVSASSSTTTTTGAASTTTTTLPAVFIIVMGTQDWSSINANPSAPFINNSLLPTSAHATQYFNPSGLHPDEPNYIWLEAGDNLGITSNSPPSSNHQATTSHLVSLLDAAGVPWKAYQEGISGTGCPLVDQGMYKVKHDPFVFFDDVTGTNDPNNAYCTAHVRPLSELTTDLASGTVARYNFITPNICDDMDGDLTLCPLNGIAQGDTWLSATVPQITASQAYLANGVLLIAWDQGGATNDGPIGMIVSSPVAKAGYLNGIPYTHSSTLRTVQEILHSTPLLRDAANATDLSDLFVTLP